MIAVAAHCGVVDVHCVHKLHASVIPQYHLLMYDDPIIKVYIYVRGVILVFQRSSEWLTEESLFTSGATVCPHNAKVCLHFYWST